MANQTVGELNITMNLELMKLQAQIDSANKRIAGMARKTHGDVSKMARQINAALSTIGVGVSLAGVVAFGKSVVALGGKITDVAAEAGMGTQAFQTLALTARDSGVTMEQLATASTQMRRAVGEARDGVKQYAQAFDRLGLNAQAFSQLAPERQFELLAQKIVTAKSQSEAFTAALDILGTRGGAKLMQFMQELGTKGFDQLSENLKNVRLSEEQLKTLDSAGDKLERMWDYIKLIGAKGVLYAASIPSATQKVYGNPYGPDLSRPFGVQLGRGIVNPKPAGVEITRAPMSAEETASFLAGMQAEKLSIAQEQYNAALAEEYELWRRNIIVDRAAATQSGLLGQVLAENADKIIGVKEATEQANAVGERWSGNVVKFTAETAHATIEAEKLQRAVGAIAEKVDWAADGLATAWGDALAGNADAFKQWGNMVLFEINRVIARALLINPILQGIGSLFGGWGSLLGSAFMSAGGAVGATAAGVTVPAFSGTIGNLSTGLIPGRASGGSVSGGSTYLIGENGPELFTPRSSGYITPNHRLSSARSGDSYHFTYNIPAGVTRAELLPALEATKRATLAEIQNRRDRGKF
jgi:hypothetical protein